MKKIIEKIGKISAVILLLTIVFNVEIFSQDMAVPAKLQAVLFKKIFSLNTTLKAKEPLEISVLTGGGDGSAIVSAFEEAGLSAKTVSDSKPPAGSNVVYVMPGVSAPTAECASAGILSISGDASLAENGKVAIAIGLEGGKPKIIINFAQLKAEGQEVSANLLNIAKVIK